MMKRMRMTQHQQEKQQNEWHHNMATCLGLPLQHLCYPGVSDRAETRMLCQYDCWMYGIEVTGLANT